MNYKKLAELKNKLFFTTDDAARVFEIKPESTHVLCSRYVKKGVFIRLKKNFYILRQNWENYAEEEFFKIANFLQVPSYISFMSALSVYGITTQLLRGYYESACLRRSVKIEKDGACFNYYKLKKICYFGFYKKDGVFIATKEKAFVDAIYLYTFGKYKIDFSALNTDALDKKKLSETVTLFPQKTKKMVNKLCSI